jgi:hypothetical protein
VTKGEYTVWHETQAPLRVLIGKIFGRPRGERGQGFGDTGLGLAWLLPQGLSLEERHKPSAPYPICTRLQAPLGVREAHLFARKVIIFARNPYILSVKLTSGLYKP